MFGGIENVDLVFLTDVGRCRRTRRPLPSLLAAVAASPCAKQFPLPARSITSPSQIHQKSAAFFSFMLSALLFPTSRRGSLAVADTRSAWCAHVISPKRFSRRWAVTARFDDVLVSTAYRTR